MAQPANTFDSYDAKGIREDLQDAIYNVDPEETPFFTKCPKVSASNRTHEWQTDALRASQVNAHIEGDDTVASARTATVRLTNHTQIFKDAVSIPDTDTGLDKAGRAREMAYQLVKVGKEIRLDIEKALFDNQAKVAGASDTARRLAGIGAWVHTNTDFLATGSPNGADPTGDGSNARTDSGSDRALTQPMLDGVMQSAWTNGGIRLDTLYLPPFQMTKVLTFTGSNNQRASIDASKNEVRNVVDVYMSPWGTVEMQMSREMRPREVFVVQSDMWAVGTLRPFRTAPLAKTGDSERRQIVTELTLCAKNEKSSGGVFDLTTS